MKYCLTLGVLCIALFLSFSLNAESSAFNYSVGGRNFEFKGDFYIYHTVENPKMALRPSEIKKVQYNVITWEGEAVQKTIKRVARLAEQAGDGFDEQILKGDVQKRTADLFALQNKLLIQPVKMTSQKGKTLFSYNKHKDFDFEASVQINTEFGLPELTYTLKPKVAGYFSVVYVGAPAMNVEETEEIWQPIIWQEKRFPDMSYVTAAFQCPVPTTFVQHKGFTLGVIAHPAEFPFDPLPTLDNSRFAVALRTSDGKASPMIMAPLLGGEGSLMKKGNAFTFRSLLYASRASVTHAYEAIARQIYGFRDYRRNDIASLNETFENIVDYSLSTYSWFVDAVKGCAYSTDVPGAVKNVSSLNPIGLAMVTDRKELMDQRAYPILEFMLSREKFLFCADSTQRIQSPSRKMTGPIAPVSEMISIYNIFGKNMPFLLHFAEKEYNSKRTRNLDVKEKGQTWQNAMWIYKATGDKEWLQKATKGADEYLAERVDKPSEDFVDPQSGGFFFWTGFTPRWIDMLELYELTGTQRYLNAAHDGARHYTMFTWMSPAIPTDSIVVNPGGKAPLYWYLQRKGHKQMFSPEEKAPAWRLSEIGLTPESSGTSSGHRAIFMANYAAWMLRIAYYTKDTFLKDVAKAAIIGRYRNFPGYHINTARTTIYEKTDYPLRSHKELSVNSFHYNHIMPKASFLLDYLVTDVWYRSATSINFPSEFIEGYAYLQSKYYGHAAGKFYGEKATLWMPANLLNICSKELNYISARSSDKVMIAFTNQWNQAVSTEVMLNTEKVNLVPGKKYRVRYIADNQAETTGEMVNGKFDVKVTANGITAVIIEDIDPEVKFQDKLLTESTSWTKDYDATEDDVVRAMILNLGKASTTAYIYLTANDKHIAAAKLVVNGTEMIDNVYPYEFTVPINENTTTFNAEVLAVDKKGSTKKLGEINLIK
jgi:hypothetical protein